MEKSRLIYYDYLGKNNKLAAATYAYSQLGAEVVQGSTQKSMKLNQEVTKYYKEILHQICYLASSLGLTGNKELAYLFQYLLTKGYLSVGHSYIQTNESNSLPFEGISIMSGKGNNVSQSGMLHNLFETFNREAYIIAVGHLESYFRTYTTQVVYEENGFYRTFDSARGLNGQSDKHLGTKTPDGQRLKFSSRLSLGLDNTLSLVDSKRNILTKPILARIKKSLTFSDGILKPVDDSYLFRYLEQNRTIIDEFYRRQYANIAHVANLTGNSR